MTRNLSLRQSIYAQRSMSIALDDSPAKNILRISKREKAEFLKSFDFVLLGCDGVIWMYNEEIPDVGPALKKLQRAGKQLRFISNNSIRRDSEYLHKLAELGVKRAVADDIIHPAKTITHYIERNLRDKPVFSLCSREMNQTLAEMGVNIRTMKPVLNLDRKNLIKEITPNDKVSAVILDLNFNLTYGELARAAVYLQVPNCIFLVGAYDTMIPITKNFNAIGTLGFVNMLQECSGKEPIILGKPGNPLCAEIMDRFHISSPNRVLFVGDNLATDIKFGNRCGFQTLFVLTGISTFAQMSTLPDNLKPDYIADSLADFSKFFHGLSVEK